MKFNNSNFKAAPIVNGDTRSILTEKTPDLLVKFSFKASHVSMKETEVSTPDTDTPDTDIFGRFS
jgi:hypothetical protein